MQLGTFKVPDIRLDIVVSDTLKIIYESVKTDEIKVKDLSQLLGYKFGTEPTLFKKINSMLAYEILEGSRGVYKITKLGEDLLFPEPDQEELLKTIAFMNVKLWKELFKKNLKELPKNGLWVQLKNITEADPATAKKFENRIFNWYTEDVTIVPDDFTFDKYPEQVQQSEPIRSSSTQDSPMSQQMQMPQTSSLGKLIVPTMGSVEINADTLAIARSYLDILENKINKEKKEEISKLICVHCSQDEENNLIHDDIILVEITDDFDSDDGFKSWQCPKCQFKIFTKMNTENTKIDNQK